MNFHKLSLIIKREFVTRVRTKGFIISTLLAPLGILLLFVIPIGLQLLDSDTQPRVGVVDYTNRIGPRLITTNPDLFEYYLPSDIDSLRVEVLEGKMTGYVLINQKIFTEGANPEFIYSSGGLELTSSIRSYLREAIKDDLLEAEQVTPAVREIIDRKIDLSTRKLTAEGEKVEDVRVMFIIGNVMGFFIYFAIFIYGAFVMRGVIEEKSNRIVEVMASSVRPFELLMGKVLGVGAVGLVQFVAWTVLTQGMLLLVAPIAGMVSGGGNGMPGGEAELPFEVPEISIFIWASFIMFFIFGYLIYSAMFAAIGSAVDNEQDAAQLQFPVTIPVIIPMLLLGKVVADPNATLSVVTSMIPLFSPILMMVRIAITDVPLWQSLGSVVLMILTFLGLIWVSARIYRVGILMYGKKPTFGELFKWIRAAG